MRLILVLAFTLLVAAASAQERTGRLTEGRSSTEPLAQDGGGDRANSESLQAAFARRYPRTMAVLPIEFPADYRALVESIERIDAAGGTAAEKELAVFTELKAVRERYASRLRFAPSPVLAIMLKAMSEFYDKVLAGQGAGLCGRFAQDGSGALVVAGLAETYAAELDLQTAVYLTAVVHAIENPEYHGEISEADWSAVLGTMIGLGNPQSFIATISAGDVGDPDLCPALSAMLRTSAGLQTPEGARVRADFASNLSGY